MRTVVRVLGWACILAGVLVALYLVYALYWTGLETRSAQQQLLEDWELEVGTVQGTLAEDLLARAGDDARSTGERAVDPVAAPPAPGDGAVAVMQFARPGTDARPVLDEPVLVVDGVTADALQRGPGRYPDTAMPGQEGNFAVAGHRTTYGAPFFDLDELQPGDEIHVTDRSGARWVYAVVEQRVVPPSATGVLAPDPLGSGRPMLTLTTCNPRFSNRERLIVFAQLDGAQTAAAQAR